MPKIISEKKKEEFINAANNIDPLKVLPEKLLNAKRLTEMLKDDEIEADMLYKCGCPYEWIKTSSKFCFEKNGKLKKPKYSNDCTACWVENIIEEIQGNELSDYGYQEALTKLNDFEKFKLTSEQLEQILTILDWDKIYDFDLFIQNIKKMKSQYKNI
jgi:hypothetical protein